MDQTAKILKSTVEIWREEKLCTLAEILLNVIIYLKIRTKKEIKPIKLKFSFLSHKKVHVNITIF